MRIHAIAAIAVTASITPVAAQDAPSFFTESYPPHVLGPFVESYRALGSETSQLDAKTRELIALAVAAQIPCDYCVYVHRKNARRAGATKAELQEAVATAAFVRHFSTAFNGAALDFDAFVKEHDGIAPPPEE